MLDSPFLPTVIISCIGPFLTEKFFETIVQIQSGLGSKRIEGTTKK